MSILNKTKEMLVLSPLRLPRKIKSIKRWRINITELEEYLEHITKFERKELEIT